MPKNIQNDEEDEAYDAGRNSPYRSARRSTKKRPPQRRATARPLTVNAVPHEQPKFRKLAQAVLRLAQAEAEVAAQQAHCDEPSREERQP